MIVKEFFEKYVIPVLTLDCKLYFNNNYIQFTSPYNDSLDKDAFISYLTSKKWIEATQGSITGHGGTFILNSNVEKWGNAVNPYHIFVYNFYLNCLRQDKIDQFLNDDC